MYYKTHGIIIKKTNSGEADKVLTIVTPNYGKIQCIARGSRKPKSKLNGHLDLFNLSDFNLVHGKGYDVITGCMTIQSFKRVKNALDQTARMYSAAELLNRLVLTSQKDEKIYFLLKEYLEFCDSHLPRDESRRDFTSWSFSIKLFDALGVFPELTNCLACRQPISSSTESYISAYMDGIFCKKCRTENNDLTEINIYLIKLFRFFQSSEYSQITRLRLEKNIREQVRNMMHKIVMYHFDGDLISQKLITSLT